MSDVVSLLRSYVSADEREESDRCTMLRLAEELKEPLSRTEASAHFTASAFVIDEAGERACLVRHEKLQRMRVEADHHSRAAALGSLPHHLAYQGAVSPVHAVEIADGQSPAAHRFGFPYLLDESQAVAQAYGAERTPEFFGYDAELRLQYHGRLDDSGLKASPTATPAGHAAQSQYTLTEAADSAQDGVS